MKKLLAVSTAAAIGALAVPAIAYAASAGNPLVCHASFTSHPESGAGWANDTFTRTTTISKSGKGWTVHIDDKGTFVSVPGKPSDGDNSVPIENAVTGSLHGRGNYTVTGSGAPHCPIHDSWTGTAGPTTGTWPLHFWMPAGAVSASGINPWHWDYRTGCEHMVEDSRFTNVDGNIVGKICPKKPTPTPTTTTPEPTPSDSNPAPSDSPSPTDSSSPTSDAPAPTPVKSNLPVTG